MTGFIAEMTNYLIPASGAPRCFKFEQNMVAEQNYQVDFRQITSEQGKAFRPYGMFIDNTRGAGRLEFLIQGLNFAGYVEPGQFFMTPYPAPMQQEVTLRGNGPAVVLFVDFPVMPYSSAQLTGGSSGGGGGSIDVTPITDALALLVKETTFTMNGNAITGNQLQILGAIRSLADSLGTPLQNGFANQWQSGINLLRTRVEALTGFNTDGDPLPETFNTLPRRYTYNPDGTIATEVRVDRYELFTKTFTYTDGKLTQESGWVLSYP